MSEIVRVLRVLEYIGPRDWIERTLAKGSVPAQGTHEIPGEMRINSAIVSPFPEYIDVRTLPNEEI